MVEAREHPTGRYGVFVVPVGQTEPLGWLTAKKPDGTRTIREMDVGEATQRNAFARPGSIGALSQSARALRRSREDGSASARDSPISRSATRASKEGLGLSRAERRSRELSSTSHIQYCSRRWSRILWAVDPHELCVRQRRRRWRTPPTNRTTICTFGLFSSSSGSSSQSCKIRAASPSAKNITRMLQHSSREKVHSSLRWQRATRSNERRRTLLPSEQRSRLLKIF